MTPTTPTSTRSLAPFPVFFCNSYIILCIERVGTLSYYNVQSIIIILYWVGYCHILALSSSYNSDLTSGLADPCKITNCTSELQAANMTVCCSKPLIIITVRAFHCHGLLHGQRSIIMIMVNSFQSVDHNNCTVS